MQNRRLAACVIGLLAISGCLAFRLGSKPDISMGSIIFKDAEVKAVNLGHLRGGPLRLVVVDKREEHTLSQPLIDSVTGVFQRHLEKSGLKLDKAAPDKLTVQVREFSLDYTQGVGAYKSCVELKLIYAAAGRPQRWKYTSHKCQDLLARGPLGELVAENVARAAYRLAVQDAMQALAESPDLKALLAAAPAPRGEGAPPAVDGSAEAN